MGIFWAFIVSLLILRPGFAVADSKNFPVKYKNDPHQCAKLAGKLIDDTNDFFIEENSIDKNQQLPTFSKLKCYLVTGAASVGYDFSLEYTHYVSAQMNPTSTRWLLTEEGTGTSTQTQIKADTGTMKADLVFMRNCDLEKIVFNFCGENFEFDRDKCQIRLDTDAKNKIHPDLMAQVRDIMTSHLRGPFFCTKKNLGSYYTQLAKLATEGYESHICALLQNNKANWTSGNYTAVKDVQIMTKAGSGPQ